MAKQRKRVTVNRLARLRLAAPLAAGALLLGVAGCGNAARTTALVAPVSSATLLPADSPLIKSVSVGSVTGGDRGNQFWQSEISSDSFRQALETSLDLTQMLGPNDAPLVVDATLERIESPQLNVNLTVTTTVYYRVRSTRSGAIVWQERIVTPHTAQFTESFVRSERLRLAAEGSAKSNIATFLERFTSAANANPYQFVN